MTPAEESVLVLLEAWKLMIGRLADPKITHSDGVASMFGNVPLPFFNMSAFDRPVVDEADLRGLLALTRGRARTCQYDSMVGLCEAWLPEDWARIVEQEGFALALNLTWMTGNQLLPPRRALPDLVIRRVADEAAARDLSSINATAYGLPLEWFDCICNLRLWHADSRGYVGYAGGRAVTCAAVFPVAGTMYVGMVATLPEAQGKGYADAVMRYAIEQGRSLMGPLRITLHASDAGEPVYRAMGFEAGGRLPLLVPAGAS
jgi:GNAT superfamily N-acetyltransferase